MGLFKSLHHTNLLCLGVYEESPGNSLHVEGHFEAFIGVDVHKPIVHVFVFCRKFLIYFNRSLAVVVCFFNEQKQPRFV